MDEHPAADDVTPEMIEAGTARLGDLLEAGVSSAYLVREVYLAMVAASPAEADTGAMSLEAAQQVRDFIFKRLRMSIAEANSFTVK